MGHLGIHGTITFLQNPYNKSAKNYFAVNTDIDWTAGRNGLSDALRQATLPFDYITYTLK